MHFATSIPSTLDKGPLGFGKEDLHVKVKYFKIPPDIVRHCSRVDHSYTLRIASYI